MDKSNIDLKKQIKFSYTDQIVKNDILHKKPSIPDSSQKSTPTPVPSKPDIKDIASNLSKELKIGSGIKESSRKGSADKTAKSNNASMMFNGVSND